MPKTLHFLKIELSYPTGLPPQLRVIVTGHAKQSGQIAVPAAKSQPGQAGCRTPSLRSTMIIMGTVELFYFIVASLARRT